MATIDRKSNNFWWEVVEWGKENLSRKQQAFLQLDKLSVCEHLYHHIICEYSQKQMEFYLMELRDPKYQTSSLHELKDGKEFISRVFRFTRIIMAALHTQDQDEICRIVIDTAYAMVAGTSASIGKPICFITLMGFLDEARNILTCLNCCQNQDNIKRAIHEILRYKGCILCNVAQDVLLH